MKDSEPAKSPDFEAVFTDKFRDFFKRSVVQTATKSLVDGVEIEIQIKEFGDKPREIFCLRRENKLNITRSGPGDNPQIIMKLTPQAAVELLANPSENVGEIGVQCAMFLASPNLQRKLDLEFKAGFLALLSKGFVGVVLAGGKTFAAHLASKGLDGVGAIKALLAKFKK